jgi:hypothetical protein
MSNCEILDTIAMDSVFAGSSWGISLTTIPLLSPITWGGDLGDHFRLLTADGHQIITAWDTPGTKTLTARCEDAEKSFTVFVRRCEIVELRRSQSYPFLRQLVMLQALTSPAASDTHPERTLRWDGDLGTSPRNDAGSR